MSCLPATPAELRHDWLGLTALIEATSRRQTVPCRNGTDVPREWWTSDSKAERVKAAQACAPCPVIAQCRQYGIDHYAESGAYGGLVESQRQQAANEMASR